MAVTADDLSLPMLVENRGPRSSQASSCNSLALGDLEPLASSTARSLTFTRPLSDLTITRPRTRITPEVRGGTYDANQVRFDADDDMATSRFNTEQAAEFEVEHNWVLKEAEERQLKKFDVTKRQLAICLPDEDPLDAIQQRLEEIQSMVKPKAEFANFLEEIPPEQKARILRITNTNVETIKQERRQKWKSIDRLKYAVFMVLLVLKASSQSRRYFNEEDPSAGQIAMKRFRRKQTDNNKNQTKLPIHKSSLSYEMQQALTTVPEYRTNHHIRRIQWVLRATRAFKNYFPTEMEKEVARVVGYDRYDDNRHIAYQGRPPERFYYILSGRVRQVREYRLTSGSVNKAMGFMNKGSCSDLEELENGWHREFHLVASGPVEVLQIDREDFIRLQHTTQGPPIDFLWSLALFKEFPCDEFLHNPEAIEFKYYGQNRVVAKDARRTPWLHVVKSGFVKVVRAQSVVDTRNDDKFNARNTDELGCGRAFSHATVMMGLLAKQRKMKALMGSELSLPDLTQAVRQGKDDRKGLVVQTERLSRHSRSLSHHSNPPSIVVLDEALGEEESIIAESEPIDTRLSEKKSSTLMLPPILPMGGERLIRDASNPQQHGTFLTREKTEFDPVYARKKKKEAQHRRAYIQLDLLKPGDVFGLDDIAEKLRFHPSEEEEGLENLDPPPIPVYEGPAISLVSDGAEIIKISKRFFLQNAQNNTMLRVETMQRQYLSTDEAKTILYDQETWDQYKNSLMQRLIQSLTPR